MKQLLLICSLTLFVLVGCKKNSTSPSSSGTSGTPSTTTGFYGEFITGEETTDSSGSTTSYIIHAVNLYQYADSGLTNAGTVTVNDDTLVQFSANGSYLGFYFGTFLPGVRTWKVSGSTTVTGFSYTTTKSIPTISMPTSSTTINKSMGYTLTFTSANVDSIMVEINDGAGNSATKRLKGTATSCVFSAVDLSPLNLGYSSKAYLGVGTFNEENATKNNKSYKFQSARVYNKYGLTIKS